jgi:hypothetical protein
MRLSSFVRKDEGEANGTEQSMKGRLKMEKECRVALEQPGLVVFDPVLLADFISREKISEPDIFHAFVNNPALGDKAIEKGMILPLYPVEIADYRIRFCETPSARLTRRFSYGGFPLRCDSGMLVVSDIYAIIDWEAEFFRNYAVHYKDRSQTNDMAKITPGLFSVTVNGFFDDAKEEAGYELVLQRVERLPKRDRNKDIDAYDFSI